MIAVLLEVIMYINIFIYWIGEEREDSVMAAKYLVITKEKDYISAGYKKAREEFGTKCMIYDKNGTLVYPAWMYDGEDRDWAKWFIETHKVGESSDDARSEYVRENVMKAIFTTTQSDLLKYNGYVVQIGKELGDDE